MVNVKISCIVGGGGVLGCNSAFEFCCGAMRWRITTGLFDRAPFFVTVENCRAGCSSYEGSSFLMVESCFYEAAQVLPAAKCRQNKVAFV